jgi:sugar lactone lactonase YvrE
MRAPAAVVLSLGLTACFGASPSKGGGQVSPGAADQAVAAAENPYDVDVPPGYRIELVTDGLTFPTGIAIADNGDLYVVESGYAYGETFTRPRLLVITPGGEPRELATGKHAPWTGVTLADGALFVAQGGAVDGGRIVRFDLAGAAGAARVGEPRVLAENLPSIGDHHTNGPAVRDGWVYFGQGTATNSAVVGTDNAGFGWLLRQPKFHDIPCKDVTLTGTFWESDNPLTPAEDGDKVKTGAFLPFGEPGATGQRVEGKVPCSGAVMRVPVGGGDVELVAWGFRNPFGLAFDEGGGLWVTDNGYDARGSRPVFGAADMLWGVKPGTWYGWPDYSEGRPLTLSFYDEAEGEPKGFVLADHPGTPPAPAAYFPVHSSADGFDFSRNGAGFGHPGEAFVALFGDMAPTVGKVMGPVGFSVVRVDPRTGAIEDFARNRGDRAGPASRLERRGLERPVAVRFDPSGEALYVVDFGVVRMTAEGADARPGSGAIWRITRSSPP